jgi:hypothetical protein
MAQKATKKKAKKKANQGQASRTAVAKSNDAGLKKQLAEITHRLGTLEDVIEIRNLQHQYGYYLDKCIYREVVDLFADDGVAHFNGGIYRGRTEGVHRLYVERFGKTFVNGKNGPLPGFLLDHLILQDVIHVAPDRKTAKGRFRCFMQAGVHETSQAPMAQTARKNNQPLNAWWEGGMYENVYVKDGGRWKFKLLNYNPLWHADYATGWSHSRPNYVPAESELYPKNPVGPDALLPKRPLWPDTDVVPFHYPHPITGKVWRG